MANTVSTQTILSGPRNYVVKRVVLSDGSDENKLVAVDASALTGMPEDGTANLCKLEISTTSANSLDLYWGGSTATNDALIMTVEADGSHTYDFRECGGIPNNATAPTGDILVSSTLDNNDSYTLIFHLKV